MIDDDGYRPNVGIIIANSQSQLLWAKKAGFTAWQFPQGGISNNETPLEAVYRELYEEVGLKADDVEILGETRAWLRYMVPKKYRRKISSDNKVCIGQKQKWFLLKLTAAEEKVRLDRHTTPEFDKWRWIDYWDALDNVIYFKRAVYRNALCELSHYLLRGKQRYLPDKYRVDYSKKNCL